MYFAFEILILKNRFKIHFQYFICSKIKKNRNIKSASKYHSERYGSVTMQTSINSIELSKNLNIWLVMTNRYYKKCFNFDFISIWTKNIFPNFVMINKRALFFANSGSVGILFGRFINFWLIFCMHYLLAETSVFSSFNFCCGIWILRVAAVRCKSEFKESVWLLALQWTSINDSNVGISTEFWLFSDFICKNRKIKK